ncbi:MAG: hypothetical protein HY423_09040 [Candidatus Lambdaproteobacteria bacterium]|nr:hypothetical protein [Candidatus Lambdaproteobacteria bacterium]
MTTPKLNLALIEYCVEVYRCQRNWRDADERLAEARAMLYDNCNLTHVFVRCSVIESLYFTNARMHEMLEVARHVHECHRTIDIENMDEIAIVNRISKIGDGKPHLISFASKYAHFFIDSNKFPVFDSFACKYMVHLFGGNKSQYDSFYGHFVEDYRKLGKAAREQGLSTDSRGLDKFLWIGGMVLEAKRKEKSAKRKEKATAEMNREFKALWDKAETKQSLMMLAELKG